MTPNNSARPPSSGVSWESTLQTQSELPETPEATNPDGASSADDGSQPDAITD